MALLSVEGPKLRRTILWVALIGAVITIVLVIGAKLISTLIAGASPAPTTGSLNLSVANDANADGSIDPLDPTEHPVGAAEIKLTSANGASPLLMTTDSSGFATQGRLEQGAYTIEVSVGGKQVSVAPATLTVVASKTTVAALALNAAGQKLGAVSGAVWADEDADGKISAPDTRVEGAAMTLVADGGAQQTSASDANGDYLFEPAAPGTYVVRLSVPADQQKRFLLPSAVSQATVVRSNLDRQTVDFLLPTTLQ